jgi:hypothetical protein
LYGLDTVRAGPEVRLEERLWAVTIDPILALEEWAARQIDSRRLVGLLTRSRTLAALVDAAPRRHARSLRCWRTRSEAP